MSVPASQALIFPCIHCGQLLSAPAGLAGSRQACLRCDRFIDVPSLKDGRFRAPPEQFSPGEVASPNSEGDLMEMWAPGDAAPAEQSIYVPVHCRVCDTRMYATVSQVGQEIKCPDCGAKTTVKMVANKAGAAPPLVVPGEGYELEAPPPAMTLELVGYGQPLRTLNTDQTPDDGIIRATKRELKKRQKQLRPTRFWMLQGVFFYPFNRTVLGTLLLTATLGTAIFFLTRLIDLFSDDPLTAIAAVLFIVLDAAMASMALAFFGTLLVAIVEVSSDGNDQLTDELDVMFVDRIVRMLFVGAGWIYAIAPGMLIDVLAGSPATWRWHDTPSLNYPAIVSIFVLLPITQLSVLETSSLAVPVSYQILRSIRRNFGAWLAFYSITACLFTATIAIAVFLAENTPPLISVSGVAFVFLFALVIYYRLLGRLAWYCAEHLAPPETKSPSGPYEPLYP